MGDTNASQGEKGTWMAKWDFLSVTVAVFGVKWMGKTTATGDQGREKDAKGPKHPELWETNIYVSRPWPTVAWTGLTGRTFGCLWNLGMFFLHAIYPVHTGSQIKQNGAALLADSRASSHAALLSMLPPLPQRCLCIPVDRQENLRKPGIQRANRAPQKSDQRSTLRRGGSP